jgi:Rps23 Pro-64 3,4-dihydroxylase Tpa1-like proline 4-hydroxylase
MYTIIEDCSPYYIRFTHPGIEQIIDICKQGLEGVEFKKSFTHYPYPASIREKILRLTPLNQQLELDPTRASLFVTKPGRYYRAHKDGIDHRISLNYTVEILDDTCLTSWYSDEDLAEYNVAGLDWLSPSREALFFDQTKHKPVKSMTAKPNECILFNTDIWHDFDNSKSTNRRTVLTLRIKKPGSIYFEDARLALFGY